MSEWRNFLSMNKGKGLSIRELASLYRQTHNVIWRYRPSSCVGKTQENCQGDCRWRLRKAKPHCAYIPRNFTKPVVVKSDKSQRQEQELMEAMSMEAERQEHQRAQRQEQQRAEALLKERQKSQRQERQRVQRQDQERAEALLKERQKSQRQERQRAQRQDQERAEAMRIEADRLERQQSQREEQERAEAMLKERQKSQRQERQRAQRQEQERVEALRTEAEKLARQRVQRQEQDRIEEGIALQKELENEKATLEYYLQKRALPGIITRQKDKITKLQQFIETTPTHGILIQAFAFDSTPHQIEGKPCNGTTTLPKGYCCNKKTQKSMIGEQSSSWRWCK